MFSPYWVQTEFGGWKIPWLVELSNSLDYLLYHWFFAAVAIAVWQGTTGYILQ